MIKHQREKYRPTEFKKIIFRCGGEGDGLPITDEAKKTLKKE